MKITWHRSSPVWISAIFAIFGLANVVQGLRAWSEMTFPAIFIGTVWFMAGWKGTPLIPTIPAASTIGSAESISIGVATIKRRRLIGYLSALSWFVLGATILPRIRANLIPSAAIACMSPTLVFISLWAYSQCPRCGKNFNFAADRWFQSPTWKTCPNCGLSLKSANAV